MRVNPSNRKGNGNGKAPPKDAGGAPGSPPVQAGKGGGVKKVAILRTALDSGQYQVESKKIADKMARDAVREIRSRLR
ncbi:MAG: flagellar biosynthesis anti-sigma factor FlgM [Deltaproteobacteria bacterium]|nr:flagellar biosynthesis anti-sigma factor FlgM [Deltaproteobacteria bacterium]